VDPPGQLATRLVVLTHNGEPSKLRKFEKKLLNGMVKGAYHNFELIMVLKYMPSTSTPLGVARFTRLVARPGFMPARRAFPFYFRSQFQKCDCVVDSTNKNAIL
jgi:hypothetical protein